MFNFLKKSSPGIDFAIEEIKVLKAKIATLEAELAAVKTNVMSLRNSVNAKKFGSQKNPILEQMSETDLYNYLTTGQLPQSLLSDDSSEKNGNTN